VNLLDRIAQVRAMREDLDSWRGVAPEDEWLRFDADLRRLEDNDCEGDAR
jgi:hypothetical protein